MTFSIFVEVSLRPGIADPEGATIERALPALGFTGVNGVRSGKAFRFEVSAHTAEEAYAVGQSIADRLLSNPVIEQSIVRVEVSA